MPQGYRKDIARILQGYRKDTARIPQGCMKLSTAKCYLVSSQHFRQLVFDSSNERRQHEQPLKYFLLFIVEKMPNNDCTISSSNAAFIPANFMRHVISRHLHETLVRSFSTVNMSTMNFYSYMLLYLQNARTMFKQMKSLINKENILTLL